MRSLTKYLKLQTKETPQSWFQTILNKTTGPHTSSNYPDSTFYKLESQIIFEYNTQNHNFWVDYDTIWPVLEKKFGLNYEQTQILIKPMLEEQYKLGSIIPSGKSKWHTLWWRNITNWDI